MKLANAIRTILTMLFALMLTPSVTSAGGGAPTLDSVRISYNQFHVIGSSLWLPSDNPAIISLRFVRSGDGAVFFFSGRGNVQPYPEDVQIASYSTDEISLRIGLLPSTFEGTIQLGTDRGVSNVLNFSVNSPFCETHVKGVSASIGGDDDEWLSNNGVHWMFQSSSPKLLQIPYVGIMIASNQGQLIPGMFVETTRADYICDQEWFSNVTAEAKPLLAMANPLN